MDVQLEKLVRLQEVDGQTAQLLEAIASQPKRLTSLEQELQRQNQACEAADKDLAAEEAKRRRMESDLKDQQQKIVKYRDQSNSVKTNEQFRALQHEISFVEQEVRRIEDTELASMMQSEVLVQRRNETREEAGYKRTLIEKERETIRTESSAKQQELQGLRGEREELRRAITDSQLLAQYDRLASSTKKTALARAAGQRCLACQMALRPQYWNQVRAGTLLNCESCGRLLYFDSGAEPVPFPEP